MNRPTKRDTKATWIDYARHLEDAIAVQAAKAKERVDGVAATQEGVDLSASAENARLREHFSQLQREIHRLKGRG